MKKRGVPSPTHLTTNPFGNDSAKPNLDSFEGAPKHVPTKRGLEKYVVMRCSVCKCSSTVKTEDFRLNWECSECKALPPLLKIIIRYGKVD